MASLKELWPELESTEVTTEQVAVNLAEDMSSMARRQRVNRRSPVTRMQEEIQLETRGEILRTVFSGGKSSLGTLKARGYVLPPGQGIIADDAFMLHDSITDAFITAATKNFLAVPDKRARVAAILGCPADDIKHMYEEVERSLAYEWLYQSGLIKELGRFQDDEDQPTPAE